VIKSVVIEFCGSSEVTDEDDEYLIQTESLDEEMTDIINFSIFVERQQFIDSTNEKKVSKINLIN
jgi:hypothetical protein